MAIQSKKAARKAKPTQNTAPAKVAGKKAAVQETQDSSEEWSSEDEDPENGGVSEKGMKRLMQLVDEGDLDEFEIGKLAEMAQDSDEEDEGSDEGEEGSEGEGLSDDEDVEGLEGEEDDDDEEDEEDDEDSEGEEEGEAMSGEESDDDEEEEQKPAQFVSSALQPDDLPLDDIASDVSVDEDAVPSRKVTISNGVSPSPLVYHTGRKIVLIN